MPAPGPVPVPGPFRSALGFSEGFDLLKTLLKPNNNLPPAPPPPPAAALPAQQQPAAAALFPAPAAGAQMAAENAKREQDAINMLVSLLYR